MDMFDDFAREVGNRCGESDDLNIVQPGIVVVAEVNDCYMIYFDAERWQPDPPGAWSEGEIYPLRLYGTRLRMIPAITAVRTLLAARTMAAGALIPKKNE